MNNSANQETLPTRIAVITSAGGSEQAISLRSADNVCAALRQCQCFSAVQIFPFDADLEKALLVWQPDVVFPVAHGVGETGELQTLLDSMRLVHVGSDAASSANCWNKVVANQIVATRVVSEPGLSMDAKRFAVPPFIALRQGDDIRGTIQRFCDGFASGGAVVIKPAREGSSVGIFFCTLPCHKSLTADEVVSTINGSIKKIRLDRILQSVEQAFAFDDQVIVQKAIAGIEITVGVLEAPDAQALPVVEIVTPTGAWYDYEHKYSQGGSEHIIPARLPESWLQFAQEAAVSVHRHLGCRDYSRIDFIVETVDSDSEPICLFFLEINTLPGFTSTSLFPDAAKAVGYSMPKLVRRLVLQAWTRRQWRQLQAAAQPSLKQLLMEEGPGEILILPRGQGHRRSPEAF